MRADWGALSVAMGASFLWCAAHLAVAVYYVPGSGLSYGQAIDWRRLASKIPAVGSSQLIIALSWWDIGFWLSLVLWAALMNGRRSRARAFVAGMAPLVKQGLFVEGDPHAARVTVDVTVSRETCNQQPCTYLVYEVPVSLEEVALLERSPERPFYATTWSRSSQLSGFVRVLPAQAVSDHVDNLVSDLIRAVQAARGKVKHERP